MWNWEKKCPCGFTLFLPHLLNQKNKKLKCLKESFRECWDRRRKTFLSEFYSLNFTLHIRNIQLCFYLFLGQGHSVLLKLSLLRFCLHYLIVSKALVQLSHLWNSWFWKINSIEKTSQDSVCILFFVIKTPMLSFSQ